jgi:cation transport regulator ChaC
VAGIVYIAGPENANYLGAASTREIARQVVAASGPSGANPEYVYELARSLRAMAAEDTHVFEVEAEVSRVLSEKPSRFR